MSTKAFASALCFASLLLARSAWAQTPPSPPAADASLGGPGESCRARTDCRKGLKCRGNVCADEREGESCGATSDCGGELKCISNICQGPLGVASSGGGGGSGDWMRFKLDGLHPFVGMTFIGGPSLVFVSSASATTGGFLWALRGGVYSGKTEIALEISPMTSFPGAGAGPSFQTNVTVGQLFTLSESSGGVSAYWPVRVGAGMAAANLGGRVFIQVRGDLVGAAIKIGHVILDLHLPSFRWFVSPGSFDIHYLSWDFGGGFTYAF